MWRTYGRGFNSRRLHQNFSCLISISCRITRGRGAEKIFLLHLGPSHFRSAKPADLWIWCHRRQSVQPVAIRWKEPYAQFRGSLLRSPMTPDELAGFGKLPHEAAESLEGDYEIHDSLRIFASNPDLRHAKAISEYLHDGPASATEPILHDQTTII